MSFGDERHDEAEWRVPRFISGPFTAQDRAARAAKLDWAEWARRVLEQAALGQPLEKR